MSKAAVRSIAGILIAFTAYTAFTTQDLIAQYLSVIDPINPNSMAFFRSLSASITAYAYLYATNKEAESLPFGPVKYRALIAVRSVMLLVEMLAFYTAIRYVSLSDTAVLLQLRPFLLAYLSYAVLGEALTPPQIVASVVAALGEVLIIKPPWLFSTHQSEPTSPGGISHESSPARLFGMILLLVPIFTNCGNMIMCRFLRGQLSAALLLATYSSGAFFLSVFWAMVTGTSIQVPSSGEAWICLFGIMILAGASQALISLALQTETAVTVSIISQSVVVPAAILEYLTFGTHFDVIGFVGATVTFVSSIFSLIVRPMDEKDHPEVGEDGGPLTVADVESGVPLLATSGNLVG